MKSGAFSWVRKIYQRYLIDAMSAMALGLFASLIIGLILSQLGKVPGLSVLNEYAAMVSATSPVVGAAIGVAVAWGLKVVPLAMFASAATGAVGYQLGGPVGSYFAAVVGAELGNLVSGKTKVDIIAVPMVTMVVGGLTATLLGPWVQSMMDGLRGFLSWATQMQPVYAGIIVSALFGIILTAPISSAALASMIFVVPQGDLPAGLALAAGAATVGCCSHMVGFAVTSYRDNGVSGLISQGLGTSMLQVGNVLKHPLIAVPPTLCAMILGPVSILVFGMTNSGAAAGMGTSGLVGLLGVWAMMSPGAASPGLLIFQIVLLNVILPAVLSYLIYWAMRKMGMIRDGEMKLNL